MTIQNGVSEYDTNKTWEERYSYDMGTYDLTKWVEWAERDKKEREWYAKVPAVTIRFGKYVDHSHHARHPGWFQIFIGRSKNKNYTEGDIIYTKAFKFLFWLPIRRE